MKIVIRGARGVGKSSLLARLQAKRWETRYVPTPEIATANINWSYKTRDDLVKVRKTDRLKHDHRAQLLMLESVRGAGRSVGCGGWCTRR